MASVFWDAHGILFIDYLLKGKTINSDYYMALLDRLSAEIKKTASHTKEESAVPPRPCHKSMKTMVKLNELSLYCFLALHILQIWPPVTTGSLLT